MKYAEQYEQIRQENAEQVLKEKANKLLSLKMQVRGYAIEGYEHLFDKTMQEIENLEKDLGIK